MSSLTNIPIPVIAGVGQYTEHFKYDVLDPLRMISLVADYVREDAGLTSLSKVDTLYVVNILSTQHSNPPAKLAELLGIHPAEMGYSWIGACAPQWFVHQAGKRIVNGEAELVLICGAEAFHSRAKGLDMKQEVTKGLSSRDMKMAGDLREPLTEMELKYGLSLPINIYPLFENALRVAEGISISEHRREIANFCAQMSKIASKNPYAWFQEPKSADEIYTISEGNRMVAFPYSKFMCSIMNVNQAAALIVTSLQKAKDLGIPEDKLVYLRGCADASDVWFVSQRPRFHESPSVRVAVEKALEQAGVSIDQISYFDFYSCFPCAPRITRRMLGISEDDPRPSTVIGGMPYFGGPGNNYSLHAICQMVEILRREPQSLGMVQSLSWYISRHSVGIYSGVMGESPWIPQSAESYQKELDQLRGPEIVTEADGKAYIETYNIIYDKEGITTGGLVIGQLEDGRRFIAHTEPERDILELMTKEEVIGRWGRVTNQKSTGLNLFKF
jgi:acetyl-CoA C-acetyltransferase